MPSTEQTSAAHSKIDSWKVEAGDVERLPSEHVEDRLGPQNVNPKTGTQVQLRDHQQLIQTRQVDLLVTSQPFYDLDGLLRYPILQENFCLILPPGRDDFDGDLERLAACLPMVRFSASTPAGLLIDQHLRRCRIDIPRYLDADRTTMIMAAVSRGHGFSILSPTLLLDGIIEGMPLRVRPLPVKPLSRSIILVNREGELDQLPGHLLAPIRNRLQSAIEAFDPVVRDAIRFDMASSPAT